jgi:prepilin signal peptidase PulO-like enzyme (type II secretory pathway)
MIETIAILFILGIVVGSFLKVTIDRSVLGESFIAGRSRCPECKTTIAWYDNIPLFSYIVLRGRCRHCKFAIPLSYPVVEFVTGALFVWWFLMGFAFFRLAEHPFTVMQPVFWLVVGVLFVVIFFADALYFIIPDGAVILLLLMSASYRLGLGWLGKMQMVDVWWAFGAGIGYAAILAFLHVITKGKGMGLGDVKLALPLGLLLGPRKALLAFALATWIGAIVGIVMIAVQRKSLKHVIPFGPFMIIGTMIALLWGEELMRLLGFVW